MSMLVTRRSRQGRDPGTRWRAIRHVAFALFVAACGGENSRGGTGPNPDPDLNTGLIQLATVTTGNDLDPDGYVAALDGAGGHSIGQNGVFTFTDVSVGEHQVELTGLAENCTVTGANPRTVTVNAAATAQVSMTVTCLGMPRGTLALVVTTSNNFDPDGFQVLVDGAARGIVDVNGSATIADVEPGPRAIALVDVAPNCVMQSDNPQTVVVIDGATASVLFEVACVDPPDGRMLYAGGGPSDVWVSNVDGTGVINITNNTLVADLQPTWSPDGERIAFTSTRDGGDYDIYIMGKDGSNVMRVTTHPATDRQPVWAPNGARLAFVSERDGSLAGEIFLVNADGTGVTQLTTDAGGTDAVSPTWSPDGNRIAFVGASMTGDENLFSIAVDGTGLLQLTGPAPTCPANSLASWIDMEPDWSPDGSRIAFIRHDECGGNGNTLMLVDADGANPVDITPVGIASIRAPAWSPDGTRLVAQDGSSGGFWVMAADGSAAIQRLAGSATLEPDWGP